MIFDALRRWMGRLPPDQPSDRSPESDDPPEGDCPGAPGDDVEMLSCESALSRLYEFLDGELDEVTPEQVEAHFRVCARCYPHLVMERSFRAALRRAVEGESAPPRLRDRVESLLEESGGD